MKISSNVNMSRPYGNWTASIGPMTERRFDALLRLVADQRRRQAIQFLRHEAHGKTTVDELADRVHTGGSVSNDQAPDREQLAVQLYHTHLPTLADHGVVEFEPESRAVRYQPDEQIETVLDSLPDEPSLAHP